MCLAGPETKFGCGQALCGACTVHVDGPSALRSSTRREFEIMHWHILREQAADETAVSRRAFLQGAGSLLGFALTGASTESVFAAPASQVVENEVTGTFAPNGFIRINPTDEVVIQMVEMRQGVYTSLSMLLAGNWPQKPRCPVTDVLNFL
jgi:hypothetical protein